MNALLQEALRYHSLGWSIMPMYKSKKPCLLTWKKYQERQPTVEEIKGWWEQWPEANIALICGKVSGVVALDLDAKHGRSSKEFSIPPTVCSRTGGGGEHFLFKHPDDFAGVKNAVALDGLGVDFRAEGGYIIIPPSVHETGVAYEWVLDPFTTGLCEMPDWLIAKFAHTAKANRSASFEGVSEGQRNEKGAEIVGSLLHYLPTQKWNEIAWPLFGIWNSSNTPPMNSDELKTIFNSISKAELNSRETEPTKSSFGSPIDVTELCAKSFPLTPWIITSLFEKNSVNMLSAAPHQYKSWIVLHMALCMTTGEAIFGHFSVEENQRVLIVNEEDTERLLKERCLMLKEDIKDLPLFFYIQKDIKLTDEVTLNTLLEKCRENRIDFVIFDSLRSVHSLEENSSKDMQEVMDQVKRFTALGMTTLFTHHNRKRDRFMGKNEDDSLGESIRGSSALNAAVHSHLSCDSREISGTKYIVLTQRKQKIDELLKPFKVEVQVARGEKNTLRLTYDGEFVSQQEALSKKKALILEQFKKSDHWLSLKNLVLRKAATSGQDRTARMALKFLEAEKLIVSKERRELAKLGIITDGEGKANEKFYQRGGIEKENEPEITY